MFAYLKRLLEPPNIIDLILMFLAFGAVTLVSGLLRTVLLEYMLVIGIGPISIILASLAAWTVISKAIRNFMLEPCPIAPVFVAACADVVFSALYYSLEREDHLWQNIATLATLLAVAVFHENISYTVGKEEK
ncbi:MAG: hypothetical protein Q7S08_00450 [bacterium]|nr:hypothetical protein [bacterium]